MKPGELKVIAEGMGYILKEYSNQSDTTIVFIWDGENKETRNIYNPLTNNDQMVEIMEKLKLDVCWWDAREMWSAESCVAEEPTIAYEGKTINEAVCNAAFNYFSEMKK